jgi:hypothetical protein
LQRRQCEVAHEQPRDERRGQQLHREEPGERRSLDDHAAETQTRTDRDQPERDRRGTEALQGREHELGQVDAEQVEHEAAHRRDDQRVARHLAEYVRIPVSRQCEDRGGVGERHADADHDGHQRDAVAAAEATGERQRDVRVEAERALHAGREDLRRRPEDGPREVAEQQPDDHRDQAGADQAGGRVEVQLRGGRRCEQQ